MTDDRRPDPLLPHVGLCSLCRWAHHQPNKRGHVFWRCGRAESDPRFLRYPPLPVRECPGFEEIV